MAKNKNRLPKPSVPVAAPAAPSLSFVAWVALLWAGFIVWRYAQAFPTWMHLPSIPGLDPAPTEWRIFGQDLFALFMVVTSVLGMSAFGSYSLRPFKLTWASSLEEKVFAMGWGMALTSYVLLGLGALQLYRAPMFWGLWAGGLLLAWMRWFRGRTSEACNNLAGYLIDWGQQHSGWGLQKIILAGIVAVAVMMSFVPEIFYDAMVYHLGVPRWFLHEGGIGYYPSFHAQFPFLRQMLNLWGLALEGERLAKLLHVATIPLTIATYGVLSQRYSSPRTAMIAALAFLSMPMVQMNLWTTGVDAGIASFALLGFLAWVNGLNHPGDRPRWFCLTGAFSGFCFASKYPGLLIIAGLCLSTLLWFGLGEKDWKTAFRESVRIGGVASLVVLPWLIKTWILTGNPMYPYLFNMFGGRDLQPDRILDFTSDTGTGAKRAILPLLQTPWTATFSEITSFTAPGTFFLGLLGFWLWGFFQKDVRKNWYIAGSLFFVMYWFCINTMTDRMRLGIPGIAVGCFLLAHTAGWVYERSGNGFRFILASVVALGGLFGVLSSLPVIYYSYYPWNVLLGRETASAYLSYTHRGMNPFPATAIFAAIKKNFKPGERLLIVGDEKTSPCPVPFLASGVHNDSLIVQWSREAQTVDDLVQRFKRERAAYMLVNVHEAMRLYPYKIFSWDARSLALYSEFFSKHLRMVHRDLIKERFFDQTSPLMLYQFSETPFTTPPSENILLEIHQAKTHSTHAS